MSKHAFLDTVRGTKTDICSSSKPFLDTVRGAKKLFNSVLGSDAKNIAPIFDAIRGAKE